MRHALNFENDTSILVLIKTSIAMSITTAILIFLSDLFRFVDVISTTQLMRT
jgi:hypothetical protein